MAPGLSPNAAGIRHVTSKHVFNLRVASSQVVFKSIPQEELSGRS